MMMKLNEQLREARKAAHLTQQQIAAAVDMERETYTRIERGKQGTTVATMQALGDVVGLRLVFGRK